MTGGLGRIDMPMVLAVLPKLPGFLGWLVKYFLQPNGFLVA